MFKTFNVAPNAGEPDRTIIIRLSAIREFCPSIKPHQIGLTVIDLVGRLPDASGRVVSRNVAVLHPPADVAGLFGPGEVFQLHTWDARTGTEWDGRPVYVSLAQVRSVEQFGNKVDISFADGSNTRVKFDGEAEKFLAALGS